MQKVSYVAINLVGLFMAAYKLSNLGLLPTTESDWLEFMQQAPVKPPPHPPTPPTHTPPPPPHTLPCHPSIRRVRGCTRVVQRGNPESLHVTHSLLGHPSFHRVHAGAVEGGPAAAADAAHARGRVPTERRGAADGQC
jgi:hypothetical protein